MDVVLNRLWAFVLWAYATRSSKFINEIRMVFKSRHALINKHGYLLSTHSWLFYSLIINMHYLFYIFVVFSGINK